MLQNYSKIAPKLGPEIAPKWVPDGSKIAPWRPPGGLGGPWGTPGVPRQIFERFWGPFGVRFGVPKSSQNGSKFKLKSWIVFNAHFGPSGGLLGRLWGPCWGHFEVFFEVPSREAGCLKNLQKPLKKQRFLRFRGVEHRWKTRPETASSRNWAARAAWEAPEVDF